MIKHVTDQTFEAEVTNQKGTVLVDFWAPWCGPCKAMSPILDEFDAEMGDSVQVVKVNVDENPVSAGKFGIMSIPTIVRIKDGVPVHQVTGLQSKEQLKKWVNS
ncbi:thioredoxin [Paenibacillus yonginensis]|uniref:Thioredoxin n=2 Tax=Paenibacillus yonginensis TaxID=1462996 RepID=A0A1B1MZY2_9BACL|nr:thioredoxin [Paenibacillus yonginensis]